MAAYYDKYDYKSYWKGREYEHQSEVIALKSFLNQVPKVNTILDIGAGFGRLTPYYYFRGRRVILADPSRKMLQIAKKENPKPNLVFVKSTLENLPNKIRSRSIDLIITIRVLHHIEDTNLAIKIIDKLLTKNGYLILEFANKIHFKAVVKEIAKGNIMFLHDIFPKDIRSSRSIKKKTIQFIQYHPDIITNTLEDHGFRIIEKRTVSNIRIPLLKKIIGNEALLSLEKKLQTLLSSLNFGPSIFILAQKK